MLDLEESENQLQEQFINLLIDNGFDYVELKNEKDLISNFENQLRLFNKNKSFNFLEVFNYLCSGNKQIKFDKLRKPYKGIRFIDFSDFSSNIFQVSQEITIVGDYTNRYDVTILINGLPLVQIELKKSGVRLFEAFNQIQRYKNQSYSGLFDLTQIFVISNKVNTKYFFNESSFNYNLAYNWKDNHDLFSFTNSFLNKENLMTILSRYIFKDYFTNKYLMLRKYQIDAIDGVLNCVEKNENGYVWLSSNTGRLTTSFRLAELLQDDFRVIYVSDNFSKYPESYEAENKIDFLNKISTQNMVVTNIRNILALNDEELDEIKDNEFIFIFNDYEKHSLRYSPIHLMNSFKNSLFYCFTSSPLFDENRLFDRTTKSIFKNQIAGYSFKDALQNNLNLPLNVEYVGDSLDSGYDLSSQVRIEEISDYLINDYREKSHECKFKSILVTSSNEDLIRYYECLKKSDLNIVPILRHESNDIFESEPIRNYFERYIEEYNSNFGANIVHRNVVGTYKISQDFEQDAIERFELGEIDLLIIDRAMFENEYRMNILENFKNPLINTVYLDCDLDYDWLFDTMTLTNDIHPSKSQGNVVLLRDLRDNVNNAIRLFSDNNASENTSFKDYAHYLNCYEDALSSIKENICEFDKLSLYYDILNSFEEFDFSKEKIDEFNFYKDKFEHEKYNTQQNKKIIPKYNPELLDHFSIDINYIDNLENMEDSDVDGEITKNNIIFNETTNKILNLSKIDNSHKVNNYIEDTLNILSLKRINNSKKLTVVNNNQDLSKTVNVTNEYHIHIGGDSIPEINNSNRELDLKNLIKSANSNANNDEFVKICPRCRKKYVERHNYCSEHSEKIDLVYISDLIKVCQGCGKKFPKNYNYCVCCDSDEPLVTEIKKIETLPNNYYNFNNYLNSYTEISDLLSSENIEKLANFDFTKQDFDNIINNIKITYKTILDYLIEEYGIDLNTISTVDKILLFSKSFVKTDYKEGGGDLGHFEFNEIHVDDRATDALQITTLIHELSHFLLAEILEQIVSLILDSNKTDAIEAFVCYILVNDELNYLVDEYCAHTVEGRFAVLGYQDYGSYQSVLSSFLNVYNEDYIEVANGIGNTFACYIKSIMESFIDEPLRNEIKSEYLKINDVPKYNALKYETNEIYEWERFSKAIQLMLTSNIDNLLDNPQDLDKLKKYAVKFKKNNEG